MDISFNSNDGSSMGYMFRVHPNESNDKRYDMYNLCINVTDFTSNKVGVTLYKVTGLCWDWYDWKPYAAGQPVGGTFGATYGSYSSTPIQTYTSGGKLYVGYNSAEGAGRFGGFTNTLANVGTVIVNELDNQLSSEILDIKQTTFKGYGSRHKVRLINKGSKIQVYIEDMTNPIIDINDSSFSSGYYGLFHISNSDPIFHNYTAEYTKVKDFADINSQMKWRENSIRLVNTINTKEDNTIANPGIITSALNNNINYIMWSRLKNIDFNLNFIKNIENMGNAFYYKKDDEVGN